MMPNNKNAARYSPSLLIQFPLQLAVPQFFRMALFFISLVPGKEKMHIN